MRLSRLLLTLLLGVGGAFAQTAAPAFLPLAAGNRWVYQNADGREKVVEVSLPGLVGGKVYYWVKGFAQIPLWVRQSEDGNLYAYNEETEREDVLLRWAPGQPYRTDRLHACPLEAHTMDRRVKHRLPAGVKGAALQIQYRSAACADAGLEEDLYLENIGLVRRTFTTLAGPEVYELHFARVGGITYTRQRAVSFSVAVDRCTVERTPEEAIPALNATLRLTSPPGERVSFRQPSSQQYDLVWKDPSGNTLWRWSEGRAFLPVVRDVAITGDLVYEALVPMRNNAGAPLPDGEYTLEAWLLTDSPDRQFAASAPITLRSAAAGTPVP
jgi:hypothetical protein